MGKKLLTIAGLALVLTLVNGGKASAQSLEIKPFANDSEIVKVLGFQLNQPTSLAVITEPEPEKPTEPEPPKPIEYTVVEGDNLTKIAKAHQITLERLWSKNTNIKHQDEIKPGDKLVIPLSDEALAAREFVTPVIPAPSISTPSQKPVTRAVGGSFSGGNTYDYGYCTWYVKNKRGSSLPNGLGNANTWYARAKAMGMAVGSTPRAGAVGTTTRGSLGHVVYVESVNGNGTVNISEMNYRAWGEVSYRTASASEFVYIY